MKKLISLLLVLVLVLGVFTGCTSSGEETTSTKTETTSAETETTSTETTKTEAVSSSATVDPVLSGDTIKIGVSIARTGTAAEVGQNCYNSFEIAVDEINAAGGICGKPVELVYEDSQNDATQAVEIAKKFIEDETLLCTVTGDSSTCNIACASYYEEAKMPVIAGCASNAALTPLGDYIFSVAGRSTDEIPFCIEGVLKGYYDVEKLAVIYANDDWGVGLYDSAVELCALVGIEIVGAESFNVGETDFTSVLSKLRAKEPESVLVIAQYAEAGLIVNQIKKMGWDVIISNTGAVVNDDFLKLVGEDGEGLVGYVGMAFVDAYPASMAFYNEYIERYDGRTPTVHSTCYECLKLVAQAANSCGEDLSRETLRDAIASVKDFEGLTGKFSIEEDGNITRLFHVVEVIDGKWTKVD